MQPSEAKLWNYDEIVMKGGKHEQKKKNHLFRGFIDIKVNMTESDGCGSKMDLRPCAHTSQLNLQMFKYNLTWIIFIKKISAYTERRETEGG